MIHVQKILHKIHLKKKRKKKKKTSLEMEIKEWNPTFGYQIHNH